MNTEEEYNTELWRTLSKIFVQVDIFSNCSQNYTYYWKRLLTFILFNMYTLRKFVTVLLSEFILFLLCDGIPWQQSDFYLSL